MDGEHESGQQHGNGRGRFKNQPPLIEVGKLFDRLPPHSPEAEASLLGSMLLDPQRAIPEVLGIIPDNSFFHDWKHQAVFQALVDVYDSHQSGDLVLINEALRDRGVLEKLGGGEFLVDLAGAVPSAANATYYARVVSSKARLRQLIDAAGRIIYDAYHTGEMGLDADRNVIDAAESAIFRISQEDEKSDPQRLAELLHQELERIEANEGRGITGIATGFADLDETLSGLQPGEMLVLAARPSMGKTALALNLAEQIALGGKLPAEVRGEFEGVPVGFFSLEMSKSAVVQRLICAHAGLDSQRLRSGLLGASEMRQAMEACETLADAPLYIDDMPGLTVMQLRARARRMVAQHGVKVIFVDYLQLLTAPGASRESRQVEVSAISRGIKALARELDVPVVCLSQLNRNPESRDGRGHRPRMSDLRESGSIEQDADVVSLLHREDYYHRGEPEWDPESDQFDERNLDKIGTAELIIAKQRNGPTGTVKFTWDDRSTRFRPHSRKAAGDDRVHDARAAREGPDWAHGEPRPMPRLTPQPDPGPGDDEDDVGGVPF